MTEAKPVKFKPLWDKIPEVILYVVSSHQDLTIYQVVKAIFIADLNHLNKYGRPITFDNYVAMKHGPVPSNIYDLLRSEEKYEQRYGHASPWTSEKVGNARHFRSAKRPPNKRKLSGSDMKMLDTAVRVVADMSFKEIWDFTHDHPAYRSAWAARRDRGSEPMRWEELLDGQNKSRVNELEYMSQSR